MDWYTGLAAPVQALLALGGAAALGLLAHALFYSLYARVGDRFPRLLFLDGALLRQTRAPARLLFPLLAMGAVFPQVEHGIADGAERLLRLLFAPLVILAVAWLLIRLTVVVDYLLTRAHDVGVEDNLRARAVRTRMGILRRVLTIGIVVLALSALMLQYQGLRSFGTGLLASAGVLSLVIGIAAQRPLSNLLAGIQIAWTQPIRVHDAVFLEDEWGWIEEITLTYVVVQLWDHRRLVLPIGYFLEHPFQNWTRRSASLIGSVFLYADYSVPVEAVRAEALRICEGSDLWDGRTCVVQVTELSERSAQVRILVSARNAARTFDLRCEVREGLMKFLQQHHPQALPLSRITLQGGASAPQTERTGEGG